MGRVKGNKQVTPCIAEPGIRSADFEAPDVATLACTQWGMTISFGSNTVLYNKPGTVRLRESAPLQRSCTQFARSHTNVLHHLVRYRYSTGILVYNYTSITCRSSFMLVHDVYSIAIPVLRSTCTVQIPGNTAAIV